MGGILIADIIEDDLEKALAAGVGTYTITGNVTIDGEIIYTPDTNKIDDKLDYVPDGQDITLFVVN